MKIRAGFVTNSSSTNFLIISKQELTVEYLFEKLGFVKGGLLESQGIELCECILSSLDRGLAYYNIDILDYEQIYELFGEKAANIYKDKKNFFVYLGYTNSSDSPVTVFFTTDSFEIEKRDFYLNGRSCVW